MFFVNGVTAASWFPRLPEVRDRLDVSEGGLGLTLVGMGLGGLVVSLGSGKVADRFTSRRVSLATSVLLSALLPLVGLASVPLALFAVLIFMGSADGLTDVAMNRQAIFVQSDLRARGSGHHVLSRLHGMWSVGTLTGGIISARAADAGVSLRVHLVTVAAVTTVTALVAARWLIDDPPLPVRPDHEPPPSRRATTTLLVRIFLVGTAVALAEAPPHEWASLMWVDHYDVTEGRAALAYVAVTAGMVAGRFSGDWVVGRFGTEPTRRAGAALTAAGVVLATLAPAPALSAVGMFVTGTGVSQLFPLTIAAGTAATGGRSSGMAAFSSGARFGFLLGPPVVGVLSGATSVATAVLMVAGSAALVSVFVRFGQGSRRPC
jgi:MFS family permease